jgi:hypothetical protein
MDEGKLRFEFHQKLKEVAYKANFCPNDEWIFKVTNDLFEHFDITEKVTLPK